MSVRLRYLSTTLALVAVGAGYTLIQTKPWRPGPSLPVRSAAESRQVPPPPVPPVARELLDRADALSLTAEQTARLAALDRRWREDSAPLEAAVQAAERDFSRFMVDARASGRASLQELQGRSADFRELSAALRERRRLHAEAAAQVLTEVQRRALTGSGSPQTSGGDR